MGKSPGKWIKTVLFGKKSTRSKGRNASLTGDKGYNSGKGSPTLTVSSPVISGPVLVSIESNGIVPEAEKGTTSISSEAITLDTSQNLEKEASVGSTLSNDPERMKEEQAAIKAQAAFRGFLARRAFHALRGIIRLQALVRGHLVRRQAVATLRSMQGIVRLQALVRGQRVRRSGVGLEAFTKFGHAHVAIDTVVVCMTGARGNMTWPQPRR